MSVVLIDASKHVVKETEAGRMFRRLLKHDGIFTYFNSDTGQWVLATWMNRLARIAEEIEDLGPAMEGLTQALVTQIVNCWKVVDWGKKKKMLLAHQKSFLKREDEKVLQDQERYDWCKKRLNGKAPIPYAFTPRISGGEVQ